MLEGWWVVLGLYCVIMCNIWVLVDYVDLNWLWIEVLKLLVLYLYGYDDGCVILVFIYWMVRVLFVGSEVVVVEYVGYFLQFEQLDKIVELIVVFIGLFG